MADDRARGPLVSVVVPAYNSEKTIEEVVRRVQGIRIDDRETELIVVDDASSDQTLAKLERLSGITVIRHERNTGKGGAVRSGLERARGDILVIEDDDLEYDPRDIPAVVQPILEKRADIVFGSRQLNRDNTYVLPLYHFGGLFINRIIDLVLRCGITDAISGSKAFTRRVYDQIAPIESAGFGVETEIAAKAVRAGFRLVEVPIAYRARTHADGKNIRWYHVYPILKALFQYAWLAPRRARTPTSD